MSNPRRRCSLCSSSFVRLPSLVILAALGLLISISVLPPREHKFRLAILKTEGSAIQPNYANSLYGTPYWGKEMPLDKLDTLQSEFYRSVLSRTNSSEPVKILLLYTSQSNIEAKLESPEKWSITSLEYMDTTIDNRYSLPFESDSFDVVIIHGVIERSVDISQTFFEIKRVMKKESCLLFNGIDRSYLSWLSTVVFSERIIRVTPPGHYDWRLFVTMDELDQVFEGYKFHVQQLQRVSTSFNLSNFLSTREIINSVSYIPSISGREFYHGWAKVTK